MKLSVVIPCFNAAKTISYQLEALTMQEWPDGWEVIVSDNGSTDNSIAIVNLFKKRLPNLRVVDSSGRKAAAHARNVGARFATGDALVFCDSDDIVGDGWLDAMGKALLVSDFVACRTDIEKLNSCWICESRVNPQAEGIQEYKYPPYLHHAASATIGVKYSVHEDVGGFNESKDQIPLEDTDYCWRIQLRGIKLQFVPDAVVHYRYRGDMEGVFKQAIAYARANVFLYKKYRRFGMPKYSRKEYFHAILVWMKIPIRLLKLRKKKDIARFVWMIGTLIGRLTGSFKFRVFAP